MTLEKIAKALGARTWEDEAREHGWHPPLVWVDGPPTEAGWYVLDWYPDADGRVYRDARCVDVGWDVFRWLVLRHLRLPDPPE